MKKCNKCGTRMIVDRSQAFTSNPAQYLFKCPKCGNLEFGLYNDDIDEENGTMVEDYTIWYVIRNWAAMFAMNGLIASGNYNYNEREFVAKRSLEYANALITELKKL